MVPPPQSQKATINLIQQIKWLNQPFPISGLLNKQPSAVR